MSNGNHDRWVKVQTSGTNSDAVLAQLNTYAEKDPPTLAVAAKCSDGEFIFVGNYTPTAQYEPSYGPPPE